jgi:hypothetical protein
MTPTDTPSWLARMPYAASAYMHAHGWRMLGATSEESLWALDADGQTWEALLPLDVARHDINRRINELLRVLVAVEGRTDEDLLRDLRGSQSDVIRVRTTPPSPSGTAPIDEAVQIVTAAREMLLSAAAAVDGPRAVLGTRKSDRTMSFVRSVQLATEPGSFIVALEAPVTPDLEGAAFVPPEDGALFPDPRVPFARRATERLITAIDLSLRACAEVAAGADITAFDATVPDGVSANFLESLVRLSGAREKEPETGREFDLNVRWSYGRRSPDIRSVFTVTSDAIPVFSAAAASLRSREPEPDVTLSGQVVGLRRDDSLGTDTVTLNAYVGEGPDGRMRNIRLVLDSEDQHQLVSRAYESRAPVAVSGDLQRGFVLTMHPVRSVTLVSLDGDT